MGAFPRVLFSEMELRAMRWFAVKNGVSDLPTIKQVKYQRSEVIKVAGISSTTVEGHLGNMYTVNDWKKIIEHELANPLVRPHLEFYPEDSGIRLQEARQAARWREEVDALVACPMVCNDDGRDFFIEESCMANIDNLGTVAPVMPVRWFKHEGKIWAKVHMMRLTPEHDFLVIDGRKGSSLDLPMSAFFLSVLELKDADISRRYNLPHPNRIAGVIRGDGATIQLEPWDRPYVSPVRELVKGKRVYSLPLWLYCDDTSGNVSKKWNKHNSILFTLAGLPRKYVQLLYNVHFIATSNIASPLEMMESVVETMKELRRDGIEAWDCELKENVLILPWILAFQGDNLMASEFSSHIGMSGKCFCRVCHVRGADEKNRALGDAGEIEQLTEFLKAGIPRTKSDTVANLDAQLQRVLDGAPSAVDSMATDTGTKDKHFQYFVDKLGAECAKVKEQQKTAGLPPGQKTRELRQKMREYREQLPKELYNPCLQISDFDPSQDSPVEILHVVLLGVVKYWWRDAVSRQNSKGKEELKTRLSSFDTAGVTSSCLRGHTLVQYAGSLVGRDFRLILQVAPSVLQGLIPDVHYQGWLALCRLAPLLFQPMIDNLPEYLNELRNAIDDFLITTALWTTQWFNKPKFHLFRFGPAILYATETFESYNLVIRLRSIHSPRHAPSLNIARAFAHLHAVRHLVSGGYITHDEDGDWLPSPLQAGPSVRALMEDPAFCEFMCMEGLDDNSRAENLVLRCADLTITNGDCAVVGKYIVYRGTSGDSVGRIDEILVNPTDRALIGILVSKCDIGACVEPYGFPRCSVRENDHLMIAFEDVICTVNTIHNCAAHGCVSSKTRVMIQERTRTDMTEAEYTHNVCATDQLLNLAQL
ncbi:hypothetical protein NEOLEDRAFT_1158985 [Neolentinus lepideus HHB14362 ss-1]|uniref:Uncharacterized protein n=1 Tax=Neolentinus lepideus HHB14362 ss-1 TaxID=1314782 RepID=A0A165NI30_9AGAM|nr:hypothetical protein NEOLEDRAFT_1158985 [Neolentinus lepideus HHB14362 ss-1]